MENQEDNAAKDINVLRRALQLIEKLSQDSRGRRIVQLAEESGLPPSTAHRILQTLTHAGYTRQDSDSGAYRLTGKMLDVGSRAVAPGSLREEALPRLRKLRELTGESAHLVVLDGRYALTVECVLSEERNLVDCRIGERAPVHCTAVGKCLIASLPDLEEFLTHLELVRFTDHTLCTMAELQEELQRVREQGYALDWEENEAGIRCIAAPVLDSSGRVTASVGISGPATRVTDANSGSLAQIVAGIASDLAEAMGYSGRGQTLPAP